VRNGIDLGAFPPRPQPPARAAAVLVAVANLSKDKDIETLLRGFAAVAGRRPARLRLAGDGPRRGDAERLVAELGLGDSVELLGFREDVAAVLADADLFVHCARTEGLGIAVLEATASGVPVVASATGGITEIVENGVTGRLFPPGDAPAFCAAVLDALDDGAGSAAMARRARRKVEREFSLEGMCGAYAQIYRGVVDGRERN
jgi:glycosyltransferase involved in cell wall biosynthesis